MSQISALPIYVFTRRNKKIRESKWKKNQNKFSILNLHNWKTNHWKMEKKVTKKTKKKSWKKNKYKMDAVIEML